MSNIATRNGWILLKKYDEVKEKDPSSPFSPALAVSNTNLGVVVHSSDASLLGQRVYYTGSVQKLMLEDASEVIAVQEENIVAVVEG